MTSAPPRFHRTEHGPVQGLSRGQISNRFVDLSLVNQSQEYVSGVDVGKIRFIATPGEQLIKYHETNIRRKLRDILGVWRNLKQNFSDL